MTGIRALLIFIGVFFVLSMMHRHPTIIEAALIGLVVALLSEGLIWILRRFNLLKV